MSYFDRQYPGQTSLSGSCCASCSRGATTCGDTAVTVGGKPPSGPSPVDVLRAQVNRFRGPSAPSAFRYGPAKLPASGPIDMAVAIAAVLINQRRASDAYIKDHSLSAFLEDANRGFADPVAFVTKNLAEVTQTIAIYGDLNNVPPATTTVPGQILGVPTYMVIGAVAVVFLLLTRKG